MNEPAEIYERIFNRLTQLSDIYWHISNGAVKTETCELAIETLEDLMNDFCNELAKRKGQI